MKVFVLDGTILLMDLRSSSLHVLAPYYLLAQYYFALNNKCMAILINLSFILYTVVPKVQKSGKS
jgi:hypothetical protein